MNLSEFTEWYAYHLSAFSNVANWLADLPAERQKKEGRPSQQGNIDNWSKILSDVSLDEAMRATDAMAKGDCPEPQTHSKHARELRNWILAKRPKGQHSRRWPYPPRYVGGQEVFRCPACQDQGSVTIYTEQDLLGVYGGWIAPVRGQEQRKPPARIGKRTFYAWISRGEVRCTCDAGQDNPAARNLRLAYDHATMCLANHCGHEEAFAEVSGWLDENPRICERLGRILSTLEPAGV